VSICSSGVSGLKPGMPAALVVDAQYVQSILPAGLAWLYPYLPFMHGLEIGNTSTFCAADPPTWSVPTGAQIFEFVKGGDLTQAAFVNQFIQDVTKAYLWYNICRCTTVTTPSAPSAPSAPSDLPAVNPTGVVGPATGVPCLEKIGASTFPGSLIKQGVNVPALPAPTGTSLFVDAVVVQHGASRPPYWELTGTWTNADGSGTTLTAPNLPANGSSVQVTSYPATAVALNITVSQPAPYSSGDELAVRARFYCDGALPGTTTSPCCPPDPAMIGALTRIEQLVTLLQRQLAPFSYVSGTVHSGLMGTGSFGVSGILGLLANCSVPSSTSLIGGTPDVRLPIGRVNLATLDGFTDRYELVTDSQLIIPAAAGLFTDVGYSLEPGVIATFTELVREP